MSVAVTACLLVLSTPLRAQTSAFTYQGSLRQDGQPATGIYDFMFRLLDAPTNGTSASVIPVIPGVVVTNGLFTTTIDFGTANLDGANQWLEISVRTNGAIAFTTLTSRQQITSIPYAVRAANVSNSAIGGNYRNPVNFSNSANSFSGDASKMTALNANELTIGAVPYAALDNAWKINGNAETQSGLDFIGTTDDQPFEVRVNGLRAIKLEDNGDGSDAGPESDFSPNIIMGSPANEIGEGLVGVAISGGGAVNYQGYQSLQNTAFSDYAVIGGGLGTFVGSNSVTSAILGGYGCRVGDDSAYSTVSGGYANGVDSNVRYGAVVGGASNGIRSESWYSFLGGGEGNGIGIDASYGAILGGYRNVIGGNSPYAAILGGRSNEIGTNSWYSEISGGFFNEIGATCYSAAIAGGVLNNIQTTSSHSCISGGAKNIIGLGSSFSVVSGGELNMVGTNSTYCTIAGGAGNHIANNASYAVVLGGLNNTATNHSFAAGQRAKAIHSGSFVWADSSPVDIASAESDSVTFRASGGFRLFSNDGATAGVSLAPNATAWSVLSDRGAKKDFTEVDSREVLEKLANVPIQSWHYKWESSKSTFNIGPVAQDFKAAFYPGRDDKSITTLEFDGVALAAIQGLNMKLEDKLAEKETEITELRKQNQEIQRSNAELLKRLDQMEARFK